MFWGVQSFELTLLFKILLHLVWLQWLHWNNWLHFPSSLAFVTLSGCSSGFSLNGVLLTLIFLTLLRLWWLGGDHSGFLGSLIHPRDICCCGEDVSELPVVLVHKLLSVCSITFFFFFSPSVCITVESTYQPLRLKHVTLLSSFYSQTME